MGGPCDAEMMAETPDEMMKLGGEHLASATDEDHMKLNETMKTSTEEAKKEWHDGFMAKWEATPDNV